MSSGKVRVFKPCHGSRLHRPLAKADKTLAQRNQGLQWSGGALLSLCPLHNINTVGQCPVINFSFPLKPSELGCCSCREPD